MYCVKCGVKLQDGIKSCPLCHTPVLFPGMEQSVPEPAVYPDRYPAEKKQTRFLALGLITAMLTAVCIACFVFCLKTYGYLFWSNYVMLGIALVYIVCVLPLWFRKRDPLVFLPVDFVCVCGYLLFVCVYNGGRWFLGFAFPVTMLLGLLTEASVALYRRVARGRLFITGGLLIAAGCSCMLIEMFQHITFGTGMFMWSLYCVPFCSALGLFLIAAGCIPPLRAWLERKFFA